MYEKPDHYSLKARKEGYPARSVYKLEEMEKKFRILPTGGSVLDVGCAPGSWSLFILRMKKNLHALVGVDLNPVELRNPPPVFHFFRGDMFDPRIQALVGAFAPFTALVSDAAPSTTGDRTVDTGKSFTLARKIIHLSGSLVEAGGNLVVKLFQGGDEKELVTEAKSYFETVRLFKPAACRKNSFETYLIGIKKFDGSKMYDTMKKAEKV